MAELDKNTSLSNTDINPQSMMLQANANTGALDNFDKTAAENNQYEMPKIIDSEDVMQVAKIAML